MGFFIASLFGFLVSWNCDPVFLFLSAMDIGLSSQLSNLWTAALLSVFTTIWYAHNQAFYHCVFLPISKALVLVGTFIQDANRGQSGVLSISVKG